MPGMVFGLRYLRFFSFVGMQPVRGICVKIFCYVYFRTHAVVFYDISDIGLQPYVGRVIA